MNKINRVTLLYYNASIFNLKFRKKIVTWILQFCLKKNILTIKNEISSEKSFFSKIKVSK